MQGERHPPALIQFAGASCVVIVQLLFIPPNALAPLFDLVESPVITKTGVGLGAHLGPVRDLTFIVVDFCNLKEYYGVDSTNSRLVDLAKFSSEFGVS
jgi:hypothetical protein